jgi:hypothetical protein
MLEEAQIDGKFLEGASVSWGRYNNILGQANRLRQPIAEN